MSSQPVRENNTPIISIIIPAWPQEARPFGLDYIDQLDYPAEAVEVIIARGYWPNRQRNRAVENAKGEILVFFDNDSCPQPQYLQRLAPHFSDPQVVGVGGPNPALPTDKFIPNLVDAVLNSRVAILSKQHRYRPAGKTRLGGDSDLIFCNFAMRRDWYLRSGGLNEKLWPNEENEFFERFHRSFPNQKLLYDPQVVAMEPRSESISSFLRKIFSYGCGRARHFRVNRSLLNFVHLFGCMLIFLPLFLILLGGFGKLLYIIVPYVALLCTSAISCLWDKHRRFVALGIIPLIFATHLAYILGFWKGIVYPNCPPPKSSEITIERYMMAGKSNPVGQLSAVCTLSGEKEIG